MVRELVKRRREARRESDKERKEGRLLEGEREVDSD